VRVIKGEVLVYLKLGFPDFKGPGRMKYTRKKKVKRGQAFSSLLRSGGKGTQVTIKNLPNGMGGGAHSKCSPGEMFPKKKKSHVDNAKQDASRRSVVMLPVEYYDKPKASSLEGGKKKKSNMC